MKGYGRIQIYTYLRAGIVTFNTLDGPGDIIQVRGKIFSTRPDRTWSPPSPLYNRYLSLSRV
jgi:hypothetical protein